MVVLGDDMEEKQKVKQEPSADATPASNTKSGLVAGTEHAEAAVPGCSPASLFSFLHCPLGNYRNQCLLEAARSVSVSPGYF